MLDAHDRVMHLRAVADELERLPRTPERDRLLLEVRTRIVALDTGDVVKGAWSSYRFREQVIRLN